MQERYIASVDLGTSKFAVAVAKVTGEDVQVIYYDETPADGIRYGGVFNPKRASVPLKKALAKAEEELGIKIMQVVVGLPRYGVRQEIAPAKIERSDPDECISQEEVDNLKQIARDEYPLDDATKEEIYGVVTQYFATDDMIQATERDVVGAPSSILEGTFKVFVGSQKPASNLDKVMNEVGVAIAQRYFLPNAVGKTVLSRQEMENGVALIEFGGGVTSLTIYQGTILRYYNAIPFGGRSITDDIKHECGFQESLAENIKLAFGACMPDRLQSMTEKVIQIDDEEDGTSQQLPVKYLSEIITCRAKEIINAMLFMIQKSGYGDRLRNGVVLTGGGANLVNLSNYIKELSGYNVRIGYPRISNLSVSGCHGIEETGAVASVAMIHWSSEDPHLNCIMTEEEAAEATAVTDAAASRSAGASLDDPEGLKGTVFGAVDQEVVSPGKRKKEKEGKPRRSLLWGRKIKDSLGNMIDSTVGNLYDTME
ncbi:MAG: cell division protein FtsA [Bacteroidales bacterium]|nr:cell division protein FtsA [Bacteroidales bacterium]